VSERERVSVVSVCVRMCDLQGCPAVVHARVHALFGVWAFPLCVCVCVCPPLCPCCPDIGSDVVTVIGSPTQRRCCTVLRYEDDGVCSVYH